VAAGARQNARKQDFTLVYDQSYPLSTTNFSDVVNSLRNSGADIAVISSYPADSIEIVKAVTESGYKPKIIGGAMTGLHPTARGLNLESSLSGFLNYEVGPPFRAAITSPAYSFISKYLTRTGVESAAPLPNNLYYVGLLDYVSLQVFEQAVRLTKTLNSDELASYMHDHVFRTVAGDIRFGRTGDIGQPPPVFVQYQMRHKPGEPGKGLLEVTVLTPAEYRKGDVIYPYENAIK
jgi:branched-chain amino acid transport system substrate-binding protein